MREVFTCDEHSTINVNSRSDFDLLAAGPSPQYCKSLHLTHVIYSCSG